MVDRRPDREAGRTPTRRSPGDDGRVGASRGKDGPMACASAQRDPGVPSPVMSRLSSTDAVPHIMRRPALPRAVEVRLHRVVTRPAHQAPARSQRVEAQADQVDAGVAEPATHGGEVGGHGSVGGGDPRVGQRAQLDLASGLEGQATAARQRAGGRGLQPVERHGSRGFVERPGEPLRARRRGDRSLRSRRNAHGRADGRRPCAGSVGGRAPLTGGRSPR